jgi:hypothetical protein
MKRFLPFLLLAAAAFGLGALFRPALLAYQPPTASEASEPSCPACRPAKAACPTAPARARPKNDEEALAELLNVLDEVKSREAFLATVVALARFDDDKAALAAVIRNGDRLGVFKEMFSADGSGPACDIVMGYLSGQLKAELRQGRGIGPNGPVGACYGPAPRALVPPQPVGYAIDASPALPVAPPTAYPPGNFAPPLRTAPAGCLPTSNGPAVVPGTPSPSCPADSVPRPNFN